MTIARPHRYHRFGSLRLVAGIIVAVSLVSAAQAERLYFRYKDSTGNTVLNDTLPPSVAGRGYQVIRVDGSVVESVEPAKSAAEAKAAEKNAQEQERLKKWDESLLLRYSSVADIEAAKKRSLRDIQVRISILKGNLNHLKTQIEREEYHAAETERSGKQVSTEQKDLINDLKSQVKGIEEQLAARQQEQSEASARYNLDIERFTALLDKLGAKPQRSMR